MFSNPRPKVVLKATLARLMLVAMAPATQSTLNPALESCLSSGCTSHISAAPNCCYYGGCPVSHELQLAFSCECQSQMLAGGLHLLQSIAQLRMEQQAMSLDRAGALTRAGLKLPCGWTQNQVQTVREEGPLKYKLCKACLVAGYI